MDFLELFGGVLAFVFALIFCVGVIANAGMMMDKGYDRATRIKAFWYFLGHAAFVTFLAVTAYWLLL